MSDKCSVEFVSYDGEWPCYCRGNLILRIDGTERELGNCLTSGGGIGFDDSMCEYIYHGDWIVDVPDDLMKYHDEIVTCVNENVPQGCCGGCI